MIINQDLVIWDKNLIIVLVTLAILEHNARIVHQDTPNHRYTV